MTVLEELIDIALRACEKGRQAGQRRHHARGCALLTAGGKVYSGCDVYAITSSTDLTAESSHIPDVTAEKSAVLAAISDGSKEFEVGAVIVMYS